MSTLSKQVSQLSQELQVMTRLLKPLLQVAPHAVLPILTPNLTPPPSTACQLSSGTCLAVPPPAPPCSLQRSEACSLLDSGDMGGVHLPGCLLPTPNSPHRPTYSPPALPQPQSNSPGVVVKGRTHSDPPSPGEGHPKGSPVLHASPSNGIFSPSLQDKRPLAFHTSSPSLSFSMSLSSSSSLSPCQGPHLLPPPPSQDTPPPPPSHCSAPPSLVSSPGDCRPTASCHSPLPPNPSNPLIPLAFSLHPSTVSLPFSLDSTRAWSSSHTPPWSDSNSQARPGAPPQELEMQEWAGAGEEEHISFIDDEGAAL